MLYADTTLQCSFRIVRVQEQTNDKSWDRDASDDESECIDREGQIQFQNLKIQQEASLGPGQ
jgi:hypothetical protein